MPSTILLVDDEVNILLALKRTLRSTGHTVLTANSAGDALAILADRSVDLIISDYLMPHMTGIELLSQIEKLQPNAIRIILSAHADFDIVTQAIRSGSVHRYLAKPWTNSVLVEQINSLLEHEGDNTSNQKATNVTDASAPVPEKIAVLGEYNPALNQTILDSIKDGIATLNAQGELLSINPAMVDLFGYQGKELIGQHVNMLMPTRNTGQSREERIRELGYLNTSSMGNAKKIVGRRKSGDAFPVELNIHRLAGDDELYIYMFRDITAWAQAESDNKQLLRALDCSKDGFALFGSDGRLIRCNRQFQDLYRACSIGPKEGVSYRDFLQDCIASGLFAEAKSDPNNWIEYFLIYTKNETSAEYEIEPGRWIEVHETRAENDCIIVFHIDISAKKKNEFSLRDALASAKEASEARARFLAMMSHEIRTPLNGVLGLLQLLQDTKLDQEQQHFADVALSSGMSLLTIITDILDFSKIDADKLDISPKICSLQEIVQGVQLLFKPRADEKSIALKTKISQQVEDRIYADGQRLRQVLMNLVSNALKFTHQGEVIIEAEKCEDGRTRFCVTDTGEGINEQDQAHLFEEFFTTSNVKRAPTEGTGLGLAICRNLTGLMGGELSFSSQEGVGSQFWFDLYLHEVDLPNAKCLPLVTEQSRFNGRVLLVEDGETNRLVARVMLESAGLEVTTANDGVEAVEICQANTYDLILMDISMPRMNGIEASAKIRVQSLNSETPIVAMTAYALKDDADSFLAKGMDAYLDKPIEKHKLLACVADYIRPEVVTHAESNNEATVTQSDTPDQPLIEDQGLQQLINDTSMEVLPELIAIFEQDVMERTRSLTEFVEQEDDEADQEIERHLHTLSSSCAIYGLQPMHLKGRELEALCQQNMAKVRTQVDVFVSLSLDSVKALHALAEKKAKAL
ncbi:response regulator [Marinomonas sp. PE14-40]|uniref:response regulator n=1 Tax=Marinomonas sp. PE14-40 TaxID=3060621 RepID=UPI003F6635B6